MLVLQNYLNRFQISVYPDLFFFYKNRRAWCPTGEDGGEYILPETSTRSCPIWHQNCTRRGGGGKGGGISKATFAGCRCTVRGVLVRSEKHNLNLHIGWLKNQQHVSCFSGTSCSGVTQLQDGDFSRLVDQTGQFVFFFFLSHRYTGMPNEDLSCQVERRPLTNGRLTTGGRGGRVQTS